MTQINKPEIEDAGDSSKALAQQLGKLAALILLVILALVIERYCSYKPPALWARREDHLDRRRHAESR